VHSTLKVTVIISLLLTKNRHDIHGAITILQYTTSVHTVQKLNFMTNLIKITATSTNRRQFQFEVIEFIES
jgi:hypothetical protein